MPNEGSAYKRPRWTVNAEACVFCRKRKTRCRVTSASGACERCIESAQRCSLSSKDEQEDHVRDSSDRAGSSGTREQSLSNHITETRLMLARLDDRTRALLEICRGRKGSHSGENRMLQSTHDGLGREFSGIREDGVGDDDDIEEGIQDLLSRRLGTSLLYVTGINLHDRTSFVDPVGAGLISESGMKSILERFHESMDKICPMRQLLGDLVDERHPFLRSCILPYLTFMRSNDNDDLHGHLEAQSTLRDNLERLACSNPAIAIITGLIILSLSPTNGFEKRYTRQVDGFGHIGKAVDMALADGLDDSAVIGLRLPPSALADDPQLHVEKCRIMLWYLVAHRAAWVEILTSPSLSARPFLTPPFSAIFPSKPSDSPLSLHLYQDSRLLGILGAFSSSFRRARQTTAYDSLQLQALKCDLLEFRAATQAWRREVILDHSPSGAFLVFNSLLVEILVYFKITTDCVTRAPSPLDPGARFTFFRDCLIDLRARSTDCIRHATSTDMDLGILPAFHLTLAFLPFKVLRAASLIDPAGSGGMFDNETVVQYRAMLCSSHRLGAIMVAHIESHIPSPNWGQLVETFEPGIVEGHQDPETEDFTELFRTIFESDAMFDFQYPP